MAWFAAASSVNNAGSSGWPPPPARPSHPLLTRFNAAVDSALARPGLGGVVTDLQVASDVGDPELSPPRWCTSSR